MSSVNENAEKTLRTLSNWFLGLNLFMEIVFFLVLAYLEGFTFLSFLVVVCLVLITIYAWATINVFINISLQSRENGANLLYINATMNKQFQLFQKWVSSQEKAKSASIVETKAEKVSMSQVVEKDEKAKILQRNLYSDEYENSALLELLEGREVEARLILMKDLGMSMQAAEAWIDDMKKTMQ